jgi:hypothetical protein
MATADKLAQAVSLDMTGYWRPTVRTYLGQATSRRIGTSRGRPTSFVGEVHRAIRRAGGNPNGDLGSGKGGSRFNARGRSAATAPSLKDRSALSRDDSGARTRARRVADEGPRRRTPRLRKVPDFYRSLTTFTDRCRRRN